MTVGELARDLEERFTFVYTDNGLSVVVSDGILEDADKSSIIREYCEQVWREARRVDIKNAIQQVKAKLRRIHNNV